MIRPAKAGFPLYRPLLFKPSEVLSNSPVIHPKCQTYARDRGITAPRLMIVMSRYRQKDSFRRTLDL